MPSQKYCILLARYSIGTRTENGSSMWFAVVGEEPCWAYEIDEAKFFDTVEEAEATLQTIDVGSESVNVVSVNYYDQ